MSVANNLIGKTLNKRYEILRPLGRGGMGKVYLAKDTRFGKQVVVKVPTMEVEDNDFKARFMREIASLAALEHPHIVTTVDWGEIEGIPFLVLRYLGGGNLRDRITDSQGLKKLMPLEGLNQWLPQIASALDFIHAKNWVHRDLKPDNILFDEVGNPYLADFGIAKALEGAPMGVKTTMGCFIGTPQYMAPEMHLGKGIGPKADQFGLAVLVYESLAGEIPFTGATPTAIFLDMMRGKPKLIHELVSEIPLEKSNALMKGLAKYQDNRHDNCSLFTSEITGIKLGIGQLFQGNGKVSISGQIEPLQMKQPIITVFSANPDEAPSMTDLAVTKVVREGVMPFFASEIPVKVEEAVILPELASTRVIRKDIKPLSFNMPAKVEEAVILPELASTRVIRKDIKPLSFNMPAKVEEAFILVGLPSTREIRKGVTHLPSQMPVKVEAAFISPALATTREIRKGVTPLPSQMPAKVDEAFVLPELPSTKETRKSVNSLPSQMPEKREEAFILPELPSTREMRESVIPLYSKMPAKVEEAFTLPELPSTREMRESVIPLYSKMPAKVEEDEIFIQNREKNKASLRVILWVCGILMLILALVIWVLCD